MYKPRTNSEYASNQPVYNGRNTSSGKALACWFFICTNLKQTLFKPQIYGAGPCQQVRQDFQRKVHLISFFTRGNSRFPPLPRIEVRLGFVHMKTQQIEGVVMAWPSPIECAAQTCFQSMPGVCTYENTALSARILSLPRQANRELLATNSKKDRLWLQTRSQNLISKMKLFLASPNFFPSNARWLSPGRLSSRKDNCIVQIHRINAVATLNFWLRLMKQ